MTTLATPSQSNPQIPSPSSTHLSPNPPSTSSSSFPTSRSRSASQPWNLTSTRYGLGAGVNALGNSSGAGTTDHHKSNSSSISGNSSTNHQHQQSGMGTIPRPNQQQSNTAGGLHARSISRSLSTNAIAKVSQSSISSLTFGPELLGLNNNNLHQLNFKTSSNHNNNGGSQSVGGGAGGGGTPGRGMGNRKRSSSLVTVTEVGGDEQESVVDRLGNENAAWVNAPGAWLIHPVLLVVAKVLVDAIPGMTQDFSWTILNLGYMVVSYIMFHYVVGMPIESSVLSGGAYDDLTLWEQIDSGAQYTPAKKWLTSMPIVLFLASTHYVKFDSVLFLVNFAACLCATVPKLPIVHRLRFHFFPAQYALAGVTPAVTPLGSRPPSPPMSLKTIPEMKEK